MIHIEKIAKQAEFLKEPFTSFIYIQIPNISKAFKGLLRA